jgi:hypothetical protein
MCHSGYLTASWTAGSNYIRTHIVPNNAKNRALAAIHSQTLPPNITLKYYSQFYLQTIKITSLFRLCEYSFYVFQEINRISVGTSEGVRTLWQSRFLLPQAVFNSRLLHFLLLGSYRRYWIRARPVHHYCVVTLTRICSPATLDRP